MIYLDSAATTRVSEEALMVMLPYLQSQYGNPGSVHSMGLLAKETVQKSREYVAELLKCPPDNIIFTSGGSESNNMVFHGVQDRLKRTGKTHLIVSAVEHDSVHNAIDFLAENGFTVTVIQPDTMGFISAKMVAQAIQPDTGLVSVMYANNEVGTVNDIQNIGDVCQKRGVLFHVDCVHAAGQYEIDVDMCGIDFASISGHKLHAPKGVGALYVRSKKLTPMIFGGDSQEYGLRGGTENVPGIVAFGVSASLACEKMRQNMIFVSSIKQQFYKQVCDDLKALDIPSDCIRVNGMPVVGTGKVLSLTVQGVDAETLVLFLSARDVCISAGSACNSHESKPSRVLTAMGMSAEEARSSVRISFSRYNTEEEVIQAAHIFVQCVNQLRGKIEVASHV